MEKNQSLFREEALGLRLHRSMGTMRINVPLNYRFAGFFSILIIIIFILFLLFAQTTESINVRGYLDANNGIVILSSPLEGLITKANIEEGAKVKKGDILFVIHAGEDKSTKKYIANLTQRMGNLQHEYQLKKEHYGSLLRLYEKHFVSTTLLKSTEAELLELENKIKLVDLELLNYKESKRQLIKSPVNGRVTNIFYKEGQAIDRAKTLLQIIPEHSQLIARLYIPAQNIGFLKKNDTISLKYDAYPSQRFGIYKAKIKEINLAILTDAQEEKPIKVGQPYYKVKAKLDLPYINAYGKKALLNQGMTLTAVIQGDQKKIWKWILDPLYSYYGDVSS